MIFNYSEPGLGFTGRPGGYSTGSFASLNFGRTDLDDIDALRANIARLREASGVETMVAVHQVHGTDVLRVDREFLADWGPDSWLGDRIPGHSALPIADAMVCDFRGVGLIIRVADCLPVLLRDESNGIIGAAHAGRVGLLAGVLTQTVQAMRELGAEKIRGWVGPHCCGNCYEVPQEMQDEVAEQRPELVSRTSWGTPALDLGAGALHELRELGVQAQLVGGCTLESPQLFSHRGDGADTGRQIGFISA